MFTWFWWCLFHWCQFWFWLDKVAAICGKLLHSKLLSCQTFYLNNWKFSMKYLIWTFCLEEYLQFSPYQLLYFHSIGGRSFLLLTEESTLQMKLLGWSKACKKKELILHSIYSIKGEILTKVYDYDTINGLSTEAEVVILLSYIDLAPLYKSMINLLR